MAAVTISLVVFSFVFGGSLLGIHLRAVLPADQLNNESRDLLKLGMGLMATMTALVLGLQLGSAGTAFDAEQRGLTEISTKIILLDGALAHYGPESEAARDRLRSSVAQKLELLWPQAQKQRSQWQPKSSDSDGIYYLIQELSPSTDSQRAAKAQALGILFDLGQTRWLMFEQQSTSASMPLLLVVASWLTVMFISLGLFAPRNATAILTLFFCAISVSCAVFLILELHSPLSGMIRLDSSPLRNALLHVGQ
jgi:hypothetical protein